MLNPKASFVCLCLLGLAGFSRGMSAPTQYSVEQLTFISSRDYANPFDFREVAFRATFSGPDGREMAVPGFWDGGRTWRVRFALPAAGVWTYTTACSNAADAGLDRRAGSLTVASATGPNLTDLHGGILQVGPDRRYLAFQDGTPFFYLADTWWAVPSYRMPIDLAQSSEVDERVTGPRPFSWAVGRRAGEGYTVIQWHGSQGMFATDADRDDFDYIFRMVDAPSASVLRYWRQVDEYFAATSARGLVVNWGVAQHSTLDPVSLDTLERLFRYMLARYGAYPSVFFITQEYNSPRGAMDARREKIFALAAFLKSLDPYRRALTLHTYPLSDDDPSWDQPWNDWIMDQTGHFHSPAPQAYWWIYFRRNPRPLLEAEFNYEGFHNSWLNINDVVIRNSAYTAIQSGCFGYGYGASGSYSGAAYGKGQLARWGEPVPNWWDAVNDTGGRFAGGVQMQWVRKCYESVEWWKLVPVPDAIPANVHLIVKADAPRTFLVWYPYEVTLNRREKLRGVAGDGAKYRVIWFDPRSGNTTDGGMVAAASDHQLALPLRPDAKDWMLILKLVNR